MQISIISYIYACYHNFGHLNLKMMSWRHRNVVQFYFLSNIVTLKFQMFPFVRRVLFSDLFSRLAKINSLARVVPFDNKTSWYTGCTARLDYNKTRSGSQLEFEPIILDSLPISSILRHGFSFFSRPSTKFKNSTMKPPLIGHHWDMQGEVSP